jgi:hypothetical protein
MSVLVYGIAKRDAAPVKGRGLQRQPLRGVRAGPLVAIVSDHDDAPRPAVETLWDYEQTVERIAQLHPMVPARFGGVLDDDAAVVEMLDSKHEGLLVALDKTCGAVELAVRASWQPPPEPDVHTGTSYMHARLELRRKAREVVDALTPLGELARAWSHKLPARPGEPARLAYLVDRERVRDFAAAVEQLDNRLSGIELVCTGPWPPYSFAQEVTDES